jgi:aspartate kinase
VVVVSAMGKTTDALLDLARQAAEPREPGLSAEPQRRELDMLVSTGERVSMALLSIAIQARGLDAVSLTGSQSGIMTNDRHFDARIIEVRPHRIEDELARGRIVIVAGFQGMSYRREITTLGRGGSDTTAVALAAALGAEHCEIYSDVDGVYTGDPRSLPDARHIAELGYDVMQEMAESGAKVLNAQAVEWAKRHRIVIHARRTTDTADTGRETLILPAASANAHAVVAERSLALLRAPADAVPALLAAVGSELPFRDVRLDEREWLGLVPLLSVPDFERVRRRLAALGVVQIETDLASVSLVGPEAGTRGSVLAAASRVLGTPPRMLVATPLRLSVVVREPDAAALERRFHALFVECASADAATAMRAA